MGLSGKLDAGNVSIEIQLCLSHACGCFYVSCLLRWLFNARASKAGDAKTRRLAESTLNKLHLSSDEGTYIVSLFEGLWEGDDSNEIAE